MKHRAVVPEIELLGQIDAGDIARDPVDAIGVRCGPDLGALDGCSGNIQHAHCESRLGKARGKDR